MSGNASFHPDAFHRASTSTRTCAGCHLPVPHFLTSRRSYTRTGELSIESATGSDTYVFYNKCREQLHEITDLLSSPTGCPSCGARNVNLKVDVAIDPGSSHKDESPRDTAVCESCAESLHEIASTPTIDNKDRKYCTPQWLSTPPWERDKRAFTSEEFSAATVAPAPTADASEPTTSIGTREAESFAVRKAFHELIEGCQVTLGIIEYTSDSRPLNFLAIRGLVEAVDQSTNPPCRYLSVGSVDGTSPQPKRFSPDRVILFGTQHGADSRRGAEQYDTIKACVDTWRHQSESPHFKTLFPGYVSGLEYQSPTKHDYTVPKTAPIEGYPPEPDPPASVTGLETTSVEDGHLVVDLNAAEKQWVAHLTGLSDRYGFSKDWVAVAKPGRHTGTVSGTAELDNGEFIEVGWNSRQQFQPPKSEYSGVAENPYKIRRYFRVENGELVEWKREDVEAHLE